MKRINLRMLTEGTIIASMTALLFLVAHNTPDSIFYYIIPIPLAIYSFRYNLLSGILVLLTSFLAGFLFGNPYYLMIYFLPNLLIGLNQGLIEKVKLNEYIKYVITFLFCLVFDILATYLLKIFLNIDLFSDLEFVKELNINLYEIVRGLIPTVFVINAILKTIIIFFIEREILIRINLMERKNRILYFGPSIAIVSFISFALFVSFLYLHIMYNNILTIILVNSALVILMIIGMYLLLQTNIFITSKLKQKNLAPLVSLLVFILFPASAVLGVVLNFMFRTRK